MITTTFPDRASEALAWLVQGGDPNTPVMVRHSTTAPNAQPNAWWLEAFWKLYSLSGGDAEDAAGWRDVVVRALGHGARPNACDRDHQDPPPGLFGFGFPHDRAVWDAWLACPGADLNARNDAGQGVLFSLLTDRQTRGTMPVDDLLDRLQTAGLDVNTHDRQGNGALHWMAVEVSFTAQQLGPMAARWLGERGLDGERPNDQGWSGRELLIQHGRTGVLNAFEEGWSCWERRQLQAMPEWSSGPKGPLVTLKRL